MTEKKSRIDEIYAHSREFIENYERHQLAIRWKNMEQELKGLVERVRDIRFSPPSAPLPESADIPKKERLLHELIHAILESEDDPNLKQSIARRMANETAKHMLWSRFTTTPVIHELVALIPWWLDKLPTQIIRELRNICLKYILNGIVIPVQGVLSEILTSRCVFLGHCACRSAHIVDDLIQNNEVFTLLPPEENDRLRDRLCQRYESLEQRGEGQATDDYFREKFKAMLQLRDEKSADYTLASLYSKLYPDWEFLLVHEEYTPNWIRSMYLNHKAHMIHPELAAEFALSLFLSRGVIFNSMRFIDSKYTICSCPTPENAGGCVLTHWYYWGQSNDSVMPSDQYFGQRKDDNGRVMLCNQFPVRTRRPCIGCGCDHKLNDPRDVAEHTANLDDLIQARNRAKSA